MLYEHEKAHLSMLYGMTAGGPATLGLNEGGQGIPGGPGGPVPPSPVVPDQSGGVPGDAGAGQGNGVDQGVVQ